jgi:hypothetical protein
MKKKDRNIERTTIKYILQQNQYKINKSMKQKLGKENIKNHQYNKENTYG